MDERQQGRCYIRRLIKGDGGVVVITTMIQFQITVFIQEILDGIFLCVYFFESFGDILIVVNDSKAYFRTFLCFFKEDRISTIETNNIRTCSRKCEYTTHINIIIYIYIALSFEVTQTVALDMHMKCRLCNMYALSTKHFSGNSEVKLRYCYKKR